MSSFSRIKNIITGVLMLLFAFLVILIPKQAIPLIALILGLSLYIRGFRLLFYYFSMARHMVGGKSVLYRSIITLDIAILMTSAIAAIAMSRQIVVIYLLIIYAFAGFVNVLRALEAKKYGAPYWKPKFITGVIEVLFAIALLIIGMFIGDPVILAYGCAISLMYSAVIKIIGAFRRTAVVYVTT